MSHNYNTRLNSLTPIEESTPTEVSTSTEISTSTDTTVDTQSQTNANASEVFKTAILIINLEKKMTSRFDGLDNEILNLKDVINKTFELRTSISGKKLMF